ncbi:hypothetical protein J2X31_000885 [Flavobacterium arsenatis]|uniref:Outer membrane protein beta-barrel domain-containing protein n=1 Tax=Flavobacterium arsenatis TaxID=1484332 RepID=A0ABU1TLP0_9FLAO|nr:porin family protein [Flavobacterium arsenatis]MDR6966885.1 hypothetical protein [Flavobacterium arsenatis]
MKKVLLIIAFPFLFTTASQAQLHVGLKAGANMTKLDGNAFSDDFELGYQLGGFFYYNVSRGVGFQTELLFSQTNTKVRDEFSDVIEGAFSGEKKLSYVTVPILLRLNSEGLINFTAGPQFSFLASDDDTVLENGKKLFKKTDFGVVAGAEVNFRPVTVYARYVWGFSDISEFGEKANSQQIQLGMGLRLF